MFSAYLRSVVTTALVTSAIVSVEGSAASGSPEARVAIVGATVFDGTGATPRRANVLIRGDRIVEVGADAKIPRGTKVIHAEGKSLLPGLFDLHTHWTPSGIPAATPQIAAAYLGSGITSVNDFHQAPESYLPRREWLSRLATPHVSFAARVSTPGGHGADWGDQSTTVWINTPEAARSAVKGLLRYKPDLIKGFADGWRYGTAPDNTSMDEGTLRALAAEAHANGLEVLTHTVTVDRGRAAARAGVDSLAHSMQDRKLQAGEIAEIKRLGMAVIPTLAVYEPQRPGSAPRDRSDPKVAQSFAKFENALYNARVLFEAGVPIGVGTDAGMPDTPHGASTLRELELLVQAGLTPAQALVAATSVSARIMHDDADRGTIAAGKRADIVLIDGKPWEDITAIRNVDRVLVDGRLVLGKGAPPLPAGNARDRLESTKVGALIDDFERADQRSSLDTLRVETPDGGMDRTLEISQIVPREGDAQGSKAGSGKALLISARMAQKEDVYAGVAIPLTRGSVQPVDVRGYKGVRLEVKGEGAYSLRVNGIDGRWMRGFSATPGWTTVEVPFSDLQAEATRKGPGPRWTGDGITQVEIGASREPGERVWLQIDNVTFY